MSDITTILTLMLLASLLAAHYKRLRYLTPGTLTPIKVGAAPYLKTLVLHTFRVSIAWMAGS